MTNRFNPWNFITEAILNQGYIFIECSLHCVEGFMLNAKKKSYGLSCGVVKPDVLTGTNVRMLLVYCL